MSAGLQVFDPSGKLLLDVQDNLARVVVTLDVKAGVDGSYLIENENPNTLRIFPTHLEGDLFGIPPQFTLVGNLLKWEYKGRPPSMNDVWWYLDSSVVILSV